VSDAGLADQHLLETPLERRVLLDAAAVVLGRGGADAAQLAAGQGRFRTLPASALARSPAHHGVQLIDEQHHAACGRPGAPPSAR
jgi:hypothetical protein